MKSWALKKYSRLAPYFLVRAGRIELPSTPWQGVIIPLNYAREYIKIIYFPFKKSITKPV